MCDSICNEGIKFRFIGCVLYLLKRRDEEEEQETKKKKKEKEKEKEEESSLQFFWRSFKFSSVLFFPCYCSLIGTKFSVLNSSLEC